MQVTLTSKNHGQKHSFNLVVRDQEIVLTTADGEEFAHLAVETSENDIETDDGYETVPTKNFFVNFTPAGAAVAGKSTAFVVVQSLEEIKKDRETAKIQTNKC